MENEGSQILLLTLLSCSPPTISRHQYGSQQHSDDEQEYVPCCQFHLGLASHLRPEGSGGIGTANCQTPLLSTYWHLRFVCMYVCYHGK